MSIFENIRDDAGPDNRVQPDEPLGIAAGTDADARERPRHVADLAGAAHLVGTIGLAADDHLEGDDPDEAVREDLLYYGA
jgi:hypothetical protein